MERKWSMRAYRKGDEKGIFKLRKAVYPEREYDWGRFLRWWRWMYEDNPAGSGWIWFAEHNGQIVGQSAMVPVVMKIGEETVVASQSVAYLQSPV